MRCPARASPYEKTGVDRTENENRSAGRHDLRLESERGVIGLVVLHDPLWLAVVPAVMYAAVMSFFAIIPQHWYSQYRVHPTYTMRVITLMRITFVTLVQVTVAWLAYHYGRFVLYAFVLLVARCRWSRRFRFS